MSTECTGSDPGCQISDPPEAATEEHRVSGERLVGRVKEPVHQGNIRRIIVKNEAGHTILEIPLTVGVVGAVLVPLWVALGSIAALASHYTLVIEKRPEAVPVDT